MTLKVKFFSKRILVVVILSIICFAQNEVYAQKKQVLSDEEQIAEAISAELSELIKSANFIKQKNKKFPTVKGYVVYDIAVVKNGQISSLFKVDTDIKDIDFFEFMSDVVLSQKFNFKLPKQQRYKIRQTLEFN